ncbi:MAG: ComEC/Rec2 family competence protein, partial [Minisyncoccia bacterium]
MFLANLFLLNSIFFLVGILIASLNWNILILFIISGLVLFLNQIKFNLNKKYLIFFILFLFFGFFYFHFRIFLEEKNKNLIYNQEIEFQGKISSEVLKYDNYQKFEFNLEKPFQGKINVLTFLWPEYFYGDVLKIKGVILKNKDINNNPQVNFPKIAYLNNNPDSKIFLNLLKIKNYFLNQFKKYLNANELALMSGIVLGDRFGFSLDFKTAMNNSGTTHIVALSGYNISVLVLALSFIFSFVFNKKINFILILFFIFGFVLMTGAQASVVRAAIMASFFILAQNIGRIYSFWHSVFFAAVIMVLIQPKILVYDLGFELSFLSILGITYFKPVLDQWFKFKNDFGFLNWKDNLTTTLGAQLAVLPLTFLNFGKISLFSPAANILILTFIPITMFLGFVLGVV